MTFEEFNIHEQLIEAISYMNYEKASPIQEQAIPLAIEGGDILACAQTGTGKTASFVIPVLNDLILNQSEDTTTLILVPTRELAIQINQEIQGFSYFTNTTSKDIYGGDKGKDWESQKNALSGGTNIIIATPGRLMQHLSLGYAKLQNLRHLILDEADRMLDMGFYDVIKQIMTFIPEKRQTLMFSATMPTNINKLAHSILKNPSIITISVSKPTTKVTQSAYLAYNDQKTALVTHIIENNPDYDSIIIFTSTKKNISQIVRSLSKKIKHIKVEGISSDLEQKEREDVLIRFRSKETKILVATDVLSRGIDIKGINLVINYDVPSDAVDYVHRIGRTARADLKGEAITFINEADVYKFQGIETLIEASIEKKPLPDDLGEAPLWKEKSSSTKRKNSKAPSNSNSSSKSKNKTKKPFYKKKKNTASGDVKQETKPTEN